jgi:hypothetical protein
MRSTTHNGKDLAREVALLKDQLEDLGNAVTDSAKAIADDTVKFKEKTTNILIEQTQARPLTMLTAIIGIGFIAGWLCRRREARH